MKALIALALCAGASMPAFAADYGKVIEAEFPGFQLLGKSAVAPDLLKASNTPSIIRGSFRSSKLEFAAFIRSKIELNGLYDSKIVVCNQKKPYSCETVLKFQLRIPYDSYLLTVKKANAGCMNSGDVRQPAGDGVGIRTVKGAYDYFVFYNGKFIGCDPGEP